MKLSIMRIVAGLGAGLTVAAVIALVWVGSDIWTFVKYAPDLPVFEHNLRPARVLKDAQERRIKGPDQITVIVPEGGAGGAADRAIRERHRVGGRVRQDGPATNPTTTQPGAGAIVAAGPAVVAAETEETLWPALRAAKDLTVTATVCDGQIVYEVVCWENEDGTAFITVEEREKTAGEKTAETVKRGWARLKDLVALENALNINVGTDPTSWRDSWYGTIDYEPVRIARGYPYVGIEYDQGAEDELTPRIGYRTRFSIGRVK